MLVLSCQFESTGIKQVVDKTNYCNESSKQEKNKGNIRMSKIHEARSNQ